MPPLSISVVDLQRAMSPLAVPVELVYEEPQAPFRIDLTFGDWQVSDTSGAVRITIAAGVLDDIDKGDFPLAGVQLEVQLSGTHAEVVEVLNPGTLSELQQVGLVDAVAAALNHSGAGSFRVVTVEPDSTPGLLALHADGIRATIVLGSLGQPVDLVRTSAGMLRVTEFGRTQLSQFLVLSGTWTTL